MPFRIYFLTSVFTLLVGRRIIFIANALLFLGYLILRNSENESWINRKALVFIVFIMPLSIVGLYAMKYVRYGYDVEADSLLSAFLGFFRQQGFTANLIMLGKRYEENLTSDCYSLYDIIRFFRINHITRYLLRLDYIGRYTGSRENLALESGSFARIISYTVVRARYLFGYGMGSCYIAELYHDLGYAGIVIGSLIYGFFLRTVSCLGNSAIKNMIYLKMFHNFLMAPRYCYDYPFFLVFSISLWIYIAVVFLLANIIKQSK